MLATVKSLLTFANRIGWLSFNPGAVVRPAPVVDKLHERVLSEAEVHSLILAARTGRDKALLRILYASGARVSEAAAMRWCDLALRDNCGQATLEGKGSKTRTVLFSLNTYGDLSALRGAADDTDPVFASTRSGQAMTTGGIWRMVKAMAARAGIKKQVSPH